MSLLFTGQLHLTQLTNIAIYIQKPDGPNHPLILLQQDGYICIKIAMKQQKTVSLLHSWFIFFLLFNLLFFHQKDCTFVRHPSRYLSSNDRTYVAGQTEETCKMLCQQDDVHNCQ